MESIPNVTRVTITTPSDLVLMIIEVCLTLTGRCTVEHCALMLGTAAVESDMIHRVQIAGGPARGLFQMEPATARDIFINYLARTSRRKKLQPSLMRVWLCLDSVPFFIPSEAELAYHLEGNDGFACAMSRLQYLRRPEAIPNSLDGIAEYWKKFYNTESGAGTVAEFKEKWSMHKCDGLLLSQFAEPL